MKGRTLMGPIWYELKLAGRVTQYSHCLRKEALKGPFMCVRRLKSPKLFVLGFLLRI